MRIQLGHRPGALYDDMPKIYSLFMCEQCGRPADKVNIFVSTIQWSGEGDPPASQISIECHGKTYTIRDKGDLAKIMEQVKDAIYK
jgi:hypothetical protein